MSDISIWAAIFAMGIITALTRTLFLLGGQKMTLPPRVQRALRFAPAAAIVAVIVPELVFLNGTLSISLTNYRLIAAIVSAIYFLWRRSMLEMLGVGMGVYTVLRLWF